MSERRCYRVHVRIDVRTETGVPCLGLVNYLLVVQLKGADTIVSILQMRTLRPRQRKQAVYGSAKVALVQVDSCLCLSTS